MIQEIITDNQSHDIISRNSQITPQVTGYSLLINIHENITFLFFAQDPGMHASNFTAKKVALACNSCAGWVGGAGNLIAVPAVNSPRTIYEVLTSASVISCWKNILPYITLYLNSTKTGTGRLEEFSPRRLTVLDIRLDLVAWSVENHPGFG